ncbi:MAG: discoidin domain-containing protein [Acidobacteriota bacterium]|nr:discoidin domain-containing protein [Acidobacteriota bacterium]
MKTTAIAGAGLSVPGAAREAAAAIAGHTAPARTQSLAEAKRYTRGVGLYPGAPGENFDPLVVLDPRPSYRNLALLRPAYASSSYDYNLTAQLVTDGLIDTALPRWITTVVNGEIQPKYQREYFLDHFPENVSELPGATPTVEVHIGGGADLPEIDRVELFVVVGNHIVPATLRFAVWHSDDGHTWAPAGWVAGARVVDPANYPPDLVRGNTLLAPSIAFERPLKARMYRVEFGAPDATLNSIAEPDSQPAAPRLAWRLGQVAFYRAQQRIELGGPYSFTSAWRAAALDREWIYVDLGARFRFDRVTLHWIARPSEGKLQVSDDGGNWHDVTALPATDVQDLRLKVPPEGRYVRVVVDRPATAHGYILSEFQVFGRGGMQVKPAAAASAREDGLPLSGGSWRVQRAPQVSEGGEVLSSVGFDDKPWLPATVPGTVLTSYVNAGAVPDPNFGENQLHISDSFFYEDFWYRTEFVAPARGAAELNWLLFEGVNWKADVFLNGSRLGRIDGGFLRGRFEVSSLLRPGERNAVAILLHKNRTPGSCKQKTYQSTGKNGGGLGADNPTYHASIGWDWIPTIRGRNAGIWGEVLLCATGAVTLEDPLVTTQLGRPDGGVAEVTVELFAINNTDRPVSGTVEGSLGETTFSKPVQLAARERRVVKFSPTTEPQLRLQEPRLWWPTGYGEPHLYDVQLSFKGAGPSPHALKFRAGLRQMTATEEGDVLRMFINGRRFIARGGNWGFGESMLRYRAREYDAAVRYHREQNFTMIRDWVGQIGDAAFYESCDRHGIVVWQDFWLANPWDGPVPEDDALFLANARDYVRRIRRHASIGLYCGRNEWFPPSALEMGLRHILSELHPDMHYIGSSADGPVSGHGPYHTLSAPNYFRVADRKLHSEIGAPTIPSIESVRAMMPPEALWPQGLSWGLHDFTLAGAQGGSALLTLIEQMYGGAQSAEEWVELAQFLNYDSYRAMFESQSKYRMGLLLWMSHPCWPSFVWQTYDYYLEPTAAYFGCKKGSEPLHLQWNSHEETIEAVNYNAGKRTALQARVEVLNLDGRRVADRTYPFSLDEDSTLVLTTMQYPAEVSEVHFIRLTLTESGGDAVPHTNFYLRGRDAADLRAIRTLPKAAVHLDTAVEQQGKQWSLVSHITNRSAVPALMLRTQAVRARSRDRILPAIHDDNYIALMPGESRVLTTTVEDADTRGERPEIVLHGFNLL